jgi:hypothetical protein
VSQDEESGLEEMGLVTGEEVDGEFRVGGSGQRMEVHPQLGHGRTASLRLVVKYLQAVTFMVHVLDKNAQPPPNPVPAIPQLQVWMCYPCPDCNMYNPSHVKLVMHAKRENHTAPPLTLHSTQKYTHLHLFFPVIIPPTLPPTPSDTLKEQLKAASAANAPAHTIPMYDNDPRAIAPFLHRFGAFSIHGGKDPLKYLQRIALMMSITSQGSLHATSQLQHLLAIAGYLSFLDCYKGIETTSRSLHDFFTSTSTWGSCQMSK